MRTGSINWGLSSLLRRRIMSLMHRLVCWTSSVVCGCCEHLTYTFWWLRDSSMRNVKWFRIEAPKTFLKCRRTYEMFQELKLGFQARAHVKRYKTSDDFLSLQTKGEKHNRWACAQIVWVQQSLESSGSWSSRWDNDVSPKSLHQATRASWWTITYQGYIWWSLKYSRCLTPRK